jgi:hypothetical protein
MRNPRPRKSRSKPDQLSPKKGAYRNRNGREGRETLLAITKLDIMLYIVYNYNMDTEQVTIKVWTSTRKKLRMLYALTGESMVSILDRLISAELERIQKAKKDNGS